MFSFQSGCAVSLEDQFYGWTLIFLWDEDDVRYLFARGKKGGMKDTQIYKHFKYDSQGKEIAQITCCKEEKKGRITEAR